MHNLKFVEATAISAVQMEGVTVNSPACQTVLRTYQENLRLVLGMAAAPGWSAMITLQWNMATNNAAVDVWGPNFIEKMSSATPEEVQSFEKGKHALMSEIVSQESPLLRSHLEVMTQQLDELAWRCGPFVHGMFHGILKSVCVQAWTAIEVMLEDLHDSAIEMNRQWFGQDVLDKHDRRKTRTKGEKFSFRNRDLFHIAYDEAFNHDTAINNTVRDSGVSALAAVRNLLVHKAGIVDDEFITKEVALRAPQLNSVFPSIAKGQVLEFDGERVRTLVDNAISQGYKLIREVDRWLWAKHSSSFP